MAEGLGGARGCTAARGARACRARAPRGRDPHEMLWRVPFEALPIGERYLGAMTSLSYASSLTTRLMSGATAEARPSEPPAVFAAVAAPVLPASLTAHIAQTAPDWVVRPPASAEREAAAAAGAAPPAGTILLAGAAATKTAVREGLARAGVIHMAAPFRVNGASALFLPLLLTGAAPADKESPAAADEIAAAMLDLGT